MIINFITKAMKNWKVEFAVERQTQEKVKIRRGIFQEDPNQYH